MMDSLAIANPTKAGYEYKVQVSRVVQYTTLDYSAAYSTRSNLKEVCPNAHQAMDVLTRQVQVESVKLHFFMPIFEQKLWLIFHLNNRSEWKL